MSSGALFGGGGTGIGCSVIQVVGEPDGDSAAGRLLDRADDELLGLGTEIQVVERDVEAAACAGEKGTERPGDRRSAPVRRPTTS